MTGIPDAAVRAAESAIRDAVRIRLGPNAPAQAQQGGPLILSGTEAEQAARAALEAAAPIIAEQARRQERSDLAERALNGGLPADMDECRIMTRYRRQGWQSAGEDIADLIEHVIGEYPGNGIPRPVNDRGEPLTNVEWAVWIARNA